MSELKHHGVKGMKWGVIRNRNRPGGADGKEESEKVVDTRGRLRKNLDSLKRERQWRSVLRDLDKMTTKEINTVKKRIDLENDLKKFSKSKLATKKDRDDYLRREHMSDQELSRKVTRLKAKQNLYDSIGKASKEQRDFGIKVAQVGASLGLKYALTKQRIGPKDIFDAYNNPVIKTKQDAWDKSIEVAEPKVTNQRVKKALEAAKSVKFKTKS